MALTDDQHFCLRWNNFHANIRSQFELLRDNEDFTDVTIACEGQRLQAHKIVLSACSPYFKDLFKGNPCSHPIVFMKDAEAVHVMALMEFMYVGEVNIAQTHLSAFLKTAESLKIRGLTDTSSETSVPKEDDAILLNPHQKYSSSSSSFQNRQASKKVQSLCSSTVASNRDVPADPDTQQPHPKRYCTRSSEPQAARLKSYKNEDISLNPFAIQTDRDQIELTKTTIKTKEEPLDYLSDEDLRTDSVGSFYGSDEASELSGGMEIIPQSPKFEIKDGSQTTSQGADVRKLHSLDPRPCKECGRVYSNLSNLRQHMKLIHFPTYVKCPICQKPFKTDLYLKRHLISSHDNNYLRSTMPKSANNFTITNVRTVT